MAYMNSIESKSYENANEKDIPSSIQLSQGRVPPSNSIAASSPSPASHKPAEDEGSREEGIAPFASENSAHDEEGK